MFFEADDALKLALKQEALRAGVSVSALIEGILKKQFPKAIADAEQIIAGRESPPPRRKPRA